MMTNKETYKSPSQFVKGEKEPSTKNEQTMAKKAHKMCAKCKSAKKTMCKHKSGLKLNPMSKGHKPKGAHGRAAVHALGRTKTTGNFKKIEASKGKGAAIMAYQNKLKAHKGHKKAEKTGKELLGKAMKKMAKSY